MLDTLFSIIPVESEINLFGITHLSILIISLIVAYHIARHGKPSKIFEVVSTLLILFGFGCIYVWYYFSPESFIMKGLPLYTCRIAIYILAIGIFFKQRLFVKIGSYWGFFGGFFGLLLPTIFDYPFPHVLQVTTFYLHVYLFLISTYFLFVKNIGMDYEDAKLCSKVTIGFLTIVHLVNIALGTNYTATFKMPMVLIKLGFSVPSSICYLVVLSGYLFAIWVQYKLVNKYYKHMEVQK